MVKATFKKKYKKKKEKRKNRCDEQSYFYERKEMTTVESQGWVDTTTKQPGIWRVDEIHNGQKERLLAYCPNEENRFSGTYISINKDTVELGEYDGAIPHIGEAWFVAISSKKVTSYTEAVLFARKNHPEISKFL